VYRIVKISTRAGKEAISGWKSGKAAKKRAANMLTHAAKTISLAIGSGGRIFSGLAEMLRRFFCARALGEKLLVLPTTLISSIRRDGSAVSDPYDSL
jgi:hypothetical protein